MRKKEMRKVLATVAAAVMAVSGTAGVFAAETQAEETQDTEIQDDGTQAEETQVEETADWTAFAENVTLKVPVYDRGVEGVPDVTNNYWTNWVQENFGNKYNITVQYIPITRASVETDYALLAAGGNLPTILMEYDYPKLAKWAADGYLAEYDLDAFKEVAPNYYKQMESNDQLLYTEMNGVRYFAMAERPYYNTSPNFLSFVRMDWLKEVGYDHIPMTREEELDALTKIKEAGIADYPAGGVQTGLGFQCYAERSFPMDEEQWAIYGDFQIPSMSWEPTKEAIRYANKKYSLGLTDPEYYVIDTTTAEANFIAGKTYSYGAYMAADMPLLNSFYAQNPDAELAVYTVYNEDQKLEPDPGTGYYPLYRADNPFGMLIGFSSSATEDELKAAWMYMEWMNSEDVLYTMQWGVEGETYNVVDGVPVTVSDYDGEYKMGYNNNKDYWCITIEARNVGDIYQNIELNSPKGYPKDFTDEIKAIYDLNSKKAEMGYAVNDAMYAVSIEAEDEYRTKLQETFKEYYDELVMCSPDEFDSKYDELSASYLEEGYQEVLDERKAAYEAGETTHLQDNQKK